MACRTCGETKPLSEFYDYNPKKSKHGAKLTICKSCRSLWRKQYHVKNKVKENTKNKEWHNTNLERARLLKRQYAQSPQGIWRKVKAGAERRQITFELELLWFVRWFPKQSRCTYCGFSLNELREMNERHSLRANRLTVDRKDNDKGYAPNNICIACLRCNDLKGDFFSHRDMLKIGKIIRHRHKENQHG